MSGAKVTLREERLFLIRSQMTRPDGRVDVRYYETPAVWNGSPMQATLFQNYEAGQAHLILMSERDRGALGWADGSTEILDVVPLYGEMLASPNGIEIKVKR